MFSRNKLQDFFLRWYGTPCNIFKDERILKYDYVHGFKNLKIYSICPKNAFLKFYSKIKSKTRARFEPATHKLLVYLSTK